MREARPFGPAVHGGPVHASLQAHRLLGSMLTLASRANFGEQLAASHGFGNSPALLLCRAGRLHAPRMQLRTRAAPVAAARMEVSLDAEVA